MKLPYSEGSVFLVPLRSGGYGRGVVARSGKKALFDYFFGPRVSSLASVVLDDLNPVSAVLRIRFGDLGLINGEWPIIGKVPHWDRVKWPMPEFVRRELLSSKAWIVRRSDIDPGKVEWERPTNFDSELQNDSLSGQGALEIKLTKLLG